MPRFRKYSLSAVIFLLLFSTVLNAQWKYSVPFPKAIGFREDTVSICIIGDMMMHSRQLEYDCHEFIKRLERITSDSDLSIANMEFSLGGEPYSGYPVFSAPDSYAEYAANMGIDVFLTANNHVLDKGKAGLERTLKVYSDMKSSHSVQYTGSAIDKDNDTLVNPLITVRKGMRIALVNFTYGTNGVRNSGYPYVQTMDRSRIKDNIDRARRKGADLIIALPHWGEEYSLNHNAQQEEWAQWLEQQGVNLIVGSHPHVIQDTSHINGVPVIYSMGNAVSNMSAVNTRLELAVLIKAVRRKDGTITLTEPHLEFLWCTLPDKLIDNYATIIIRDYIGKRELWKDTSDYDNMIATLKRVIFATGIETDLIDKL